MIMLLCLLQEEDPPHNSGRFLRFVVYVLLSVQAVFYLVEPQDSPCVMRHIAASLLR